MTTALLINDTGAPHLTYAVIARGLIREARALGDLVVVVRARTALREPFRTIRHDVPYYSVGFVGNPLHGILAALQLSWIFRRERVDVVHMHGVGSDFWGFALLRRFSRIPFLITVHAWRTNPPAQRRMRADAAFLVRRASAVTAVSAAALRSLCEAYPYAAHKMRVVHNGVEPPPPPRRIDREIPKRFALSVGHLSMHKGTDVLLFAMCDLVREGKADFDLVLCGSDVSAGGFADLIRRLGLESRVASWGPCPNETVRQLMRDCLFYVSPSRGESCSIAMLEAMASERAVVAPAVGGVPEYLRDGFDGVLYEAGSAAALAGAMDRLALDPRLRNYLGANAAHRASEMSWGKAAATYRTLQLEALACASPR